jgi:D-alanyl-D-alanine carboxypeptidase
MSEKAVGLSRFLTSAVAPGALLVTLCATPAWAEKYSAIVIDTQTNEVLHADEADAIRYPASLTKMMTLYMLFDALDRGEIKLTDKMYVSRHAAVQAPTKLGLRPGGTITVDAAIRAVCTKSANDAAVVIAERLGKTEGGFAAKMTARARTLGMTNTNFVNASGLPNMQQTTTARDMAVLGERLFQDHKVYYHYFQTPGMKWGRRYAVNHNRLLGRVEGVDGIKTGYTNMSGYNLASSVSRNGTRLVAVVMGGQTAAARDEQVQTLIETAYATLAARQSEKATLASLPVNRVTIDPVTGALSSDLTRTDKAAYTVTLPNVAQAITDAANAAAKVLAPEASAATLKPQVTGVIGAPLTTGTQRTSELESNLY